MQSGDGYFDDLARPIGLAQSRGLALGIVEAIGHADQGSQGQSVILNLSRQGDEGWLFHKSLGLEALAVEGGGAGHQLLLDLPQFG